MLCCSLGYRLFFHAHHLLFAQTSFSLITNCQPLFKGFVSVLCGSRRNVDSGTLFTTEDIKIIVCIFGTLVLLYYP